MTPLFLLPILVLEISMSDLYVLRITLRRTNLLLSVPRYLLSEMDWATMPCSSNSQHSHGLKEPPPRRLGPAERCATLLSHQRSGSARKVHAPGHSPERAKQMSA